MGKKGGSEEKPIEDKQGKIINREDKHRRDGQSTFIEQFNEWQTL